MYEMRTSMAVLYVWAAVLGLLVAASSTVVGLISPEEQVVALAAIRAALRDPNNALGDWVGDDPCSWRTITCSGGLIRGLYLGNLNLSGTLSPEIGKLWSLQNVYVGHNAISGPIPPTITWLPMLQRLDMSHNQFTGYIPAALGYLRDLSYIQLSYNNLSGSIPDSLATAHSLFILDLSFNNLTGTAPVFKARNVLLIGNPVFRCPRCDCPLTEEEVIVPKRMPHQSFARSTHMAILCLGIALMAALFIGEVIAAIWLWLKRHQIFGNIDDQCSSESCFSHVRKYTLKEIKKATDNFNLNNILGQGGFGIVYKGCLRDGAIVAVKRLKDGISSGGTDQFRTEVEAISMAVHCNLLPLIGFCSTNSERILVYRYMPNGTVASRLQEYVNGQPTLDWPRRKRIALGTARGLAYLHEQCNPKIIHRDIKASNILLDENYEAIVADFGLAKVLDPGVSRVFTAVRGTLGRIPPEYLSTGQSSEKTDVYGYGFLLIELITGRKTLELHEDEYANGDLINWAKELLEQDQLSLFVDKKLGGYYDNAELEEMVQIALLCTMYDPAHRPKMSEVVGMLEGDGSAAERWEGSNDFATPVPGSPEFLASPAGYDADYESNSSELEANELSGPR